MLPTEEQIQNLVSTGDVFKYAIVGFSAIETALEELISESLLTSHRVELKRLSVELKADLSIALGLFDRDSKGLLLKLSKVRNFYAHEFTSGADYCSADELKSSFGEAQRSIAREYYANAKTFREALRVAFISAYYEIVGAIERVKAKKKQRAEAILHIEALLAVTENSAPSVPRDAFLREKERLERAIEEKKRELSIKRSANMRDDSK